jgi:hypothetical protein
MSVFTRLSKIDYFRFIDAVDIGSIDQLMVQTHKHAAIREHYYPESFIESENYKAFPVMAPKIKYNLNVPILRLKITALLDPYGIDDYIPIIDPFAVRYN